MMQRQFTVKKPLAARILGLIAIYCTIFAILVTIQFFKRGNFSHTAGSMLIRGQYQQGLAHSPGFGAAGAELAGGIRLSFGGLHFNVREERDRGMFLVGTDGSIQPVNPQRMILSGNSAVFVLAGGTRLTFSSPASGAAPELRIMADFAENISLLSLPFRTRHSLIISGDGRLGLTYQGVKYLFSGYSDVQESRRLILSTTNPAASFSANLQGNTPFTPIQSEIEGELQH